jgi:transglutaminase-like putative cysteine protease
MGKSRTVRLSFELTVPEPNDQGDPVRIWLPLPASTPQQEVFGIAIDATVPVSVHHDADFGNPILHAASDGRGDGPIRVAYHAQVQRHEWAVDLQHKRPTAVSQDAGLLAAQLGETRKVKFLSDIAKVGGEIRASHCDALAVARAAYDHVLATMTYDKSGEGWGSGDTEWACSMGRGNCTDFHTLFMAILRCCGVACEFEIGAAFPAGLESGDITHYKCGYHCWTRFYVPDLGWVPADVSEASRHPDKREYFFGAIDEDRVMLSRGRDIVLVPPSPGSPENFFTEPRVERLSGAAVAYEKKLEFASVVGAVCSTP